MKFTLNSINQHAVVTNNLDKGTDVVDWILLGYMNELSRNSKENGIIRINYYAIIKELPLLRINDKGAISRRLSNLCDLGLVEKVLMSDRDAYEKLNNNHSHGCQFCGDDSSSFEQHHYPVRNKDGGTETIGLCTKCHRQFHSMTDHGGYIIKCSIAFDLNENGGF